MRRYSSPVSVNNLKNTLKSSGRTGSVKGHVAMGLHGASTFDRGSCPSVPVIGLGMQVRDRENVSGKSHPEIAPQAVSELKMSRGSGPSVFCSPLAPSTGNRFHPVPTALLHCPVSRAMALSASISASPSAAAGGSMSPAPADPSSNSSVSPSPLVLTALR